METITPEMAYNKLSKCLIPELKISTLGSTLDMSCVQRNLAPHAPRNHTQRRPYPSASCVTHDHEVLARYIVLISAYLELLDTERRYIDVIT